jgi:hypothetical protein
MYRPLRSTPSTTPISNFKFSDSINPNLPHRRSVYPQYALQVLTQAVGRAGVSNNREDKLLSAIGTLNACIG